MRTTFSSNVGIYWDRVKHKGGKREKKEGEKEYPLWIIRETREEQKDENSN